MNYEKLIRANLIKRQKPDFLQIAAQLKRANMDIKTAEVVIKVDLTWAFTITYHAMMRASRALMYAHGYLPTTKRSHITIIEFTKLLLGKEYDDSLSRFNRMRRQRHNFIYDSKNSITHHEVKSSIDTAKTLLAKITDIINKISAD